VPSCGDGGSVVDSSTVRLSYCSFMNLVLHCVVFVVLCS